MAEFASKGVAGTALGLGIAGTVGLVNQMSNGCGGGLLGGLFGGNCGCGARAVGMGAQLQYVSQLQAENAALKAQNYSDKVGKQVYAQTLADNKDFRNEVFAFVKPIADEAANNRVEVARLQEQLKCCCEKQALEQQITAGKIENLALATNGRFATTDATIACLAGKVDGITKTIVPASALCPQPMPLYNSWTAPAAGAPTNTNIANAGALTR